MKSKDVINKKKPNQFKVWLISNGINQNELSEKCNVGVTSLHHLINEGKSSKRTIEKVAECLKNIYKKDITADIISSMVEITH